MIWKFLPQIHTSDIIATVELWPHPALPKVFVGPWKRTVSPAVWAKNRVHWRSQLRGCGCGPGKKKSEGMKQVCRPQPPLTACTAGGPGRAPSWCVLQHPTQELEEGSLLLNWQILFERWLPLNLLLPLFCLGFKRQPVCFWDVQSGSQQAAGSSKNHKNLPQGPDLLYGAGEGYEVFPSSVPGPPEVTTAPSSRPLLLYCQRRRQERCCTFQFLEDNHQ